MASETSKKAVIKLRADQYEPCLMRPFFKTWLTICLFMPLAAHATNREQTLPSSFTGFTANIRVIAVSRNIAAQRAAIAALEETAPA
jgi:murein DD-endopeptidase